jgi:PAS domain S-box-containing protein
MMDSLIIVDKNGIIQWASASIIELLGYLPEELQGREVFQLLSKTYTKKTRQLFSGIQNHSSPINEGLRQFSTRDGERIPVYINVNSLPGKSLPNLVLLHLHLFNSEDSATFSLSEENAEIEIAVRKSTEHEIAIELHDHINPNLVGAKLILDYCIKDPAHNSDQLQKVSGIIKDLINQIRNLSHSITEKAEQDFELQEALNTLLENFKNDLRILLRYDEELEKILSKKQKIHLVRIIQEQILNIIKHASASKAIISFQKTDDKIVIVTRDNGRGFEPSHHRNGIGIRNMLLRVNELGGGMHINSKCNEGTSIRIVFPVNAIVNSHAS